MSTNQDYAIARVFGRQFKVAIGDKIRANYTDAAVGSTLSFPEVLMTQMGGQTNFGSPYIPGAVVQAEVVSHIRDEKVIVFKYLRKNKSKKMHGHRQPYTMLHITGIK